MNEEILKLAKECGLRFHYDEFGGLETFYRAAYNKAIEDACKRIADSDDQLMAEFHVERVRALEMK